MSELFLVTWDDEGFHGDEPSSILDEDHGDREFRVVNSLVEAAGVEARLDGPDERGPVQVFALTEISAAARRQAGYALKRRSRQRRLSEIEEQMLALKRERTILKEEENPSEPGQI